MKIRKPIVYLLFSLSIVSCSRTYDIVIYGGTSAGVAAAISASRNNKRVIIIEPGSRLGGLTAGGLGQTDVGIQETLGGIAGEFYENVFAYYSLDSNCKWQERASYEPEGTHSKADPLGNRMWTFEPSAALSILNTMLSRERVDIKYNEKLDRRYGVKISGNRIESITSLEGNVYKGQIFIDATYEGDLMAAAGVSYTIGRESNSVYGETLNGVQKPDFGMALRGRETLNAGNHNFKRGVDPYITEGDPGSGLLPYINPYDPGEDGEGDRKIQAYCYRLCLTDHPQNRIEITRPDGYDELETMNCCCVISRPALMWSPG